MLVHGTSPRRSASAKWCCPAMLSQLTRPEGCHSVGKLRAANIKAETLHTRAMNAEGNPKMRAAKHLLK